MAASRGSRLRTRRAAHSDSDAEEDEEQGSEQGDLFQPHVVQRREPMRAATIEEYIGFIPAPGEKVAREALDDLDAEALWQGYISTRRPVLIDGLVKDANFQGERWRDLDYLQSVAGATKVKVEPIHPINGHFGTSVTRTRVPLSGFLDMLKVKEKAGQWYMTTQYQSDEDEEDEAQDSDKVASNLSQSVSPSALVEASSKSSLHTSSGESSLSPDINPSQSRSEGLDSDDDHLLHVDLDLELPPPTDALAHLFPLPSPALMGGLVLQQCNLWMGNGTSGKSSGLHHDFHDNLYMLLAGRKRFLIWPPVAHRWLEPVGEIFRVHRNGLMEYYLAGQPDLRPDGLTELEAASWRVRARQRAVHDADERAALHSGESRKRSRHRKGKAKQTEEQELALQQLQLAEVRRFALEREERRLYGQDAEHSTEQDDESDSVDGFSNTLNLGDGDLAIPSSEDEDDDDSSIDGFPDPSDKLQDLVSSDDDDDDDVDLPERRPIKRQRRTSDDVLVVPRSGLPGGLRGSANDQDGDFESDSSDEFGERLEMSLREEREHLMARLVNRFAADLPVTDEGEMDDSEDGVDIQDVEVGEEEEDDDDESEDDESDALNLPNEADSSDSELPVEADIVRQIRRRIQDRTGTTKGAIAKDRTDDDSDESLAEGQDEEESWSEDAEDGEALLAQLAELEGNGTQNRTSAESEEKSKASQGEEPPSFSRISPQTLHWYFNKSSDPSSEFDAEKARKPPIVANARSVLLPAQGCPAPMEVHLKPGQMLYLPASWYHEVTSYCEEDGEGKEDSGANIHMALNYWFHPPTAIKPREALQRLLQTRMAKETGVRRGGSDRRGSGDKDAEAGSAARATAHPAASRGHDRPYLDDEIWDEIRLAVSKRCDEVRAQAAARSKPA